jgi:hypothetical protein
LLAVFGEVFEALGRLEAQSAQHCQGGITQGGERLRALPALLRGPR